MVSTGSAAIKSTCNSKFLVKKFQEKAKSLKFVFLYVWTHEDRLEIGVKARRTCSIW